MPEMKPTHNDIKVMDDLVGCGKAALTISFLFRLKPYCPGVHNNEGCGLSGILIA